MTKSKATDSTANSQAVADEVTATTLTATVEAPKTAEAPVEKDTDPIKLKVTVGTLSFEDGVYQKGETFTVTRARARLFDPRDVTPTI
jgi:hypothetical protein